VKVLIKTLKCTCSKCKCVDCQ